MTLRFCVDCRHIDKRNMEGADSWVCDHIKAKHLPIHNMVSGELENAGYREYCFIMRNHGQYCGKEAKYWEPKDD